MSDTEIPKETFLHPRLIRVGLPESDKTAVLQELAQAVCTATSGLEPRELLYAIQKREKMGAMPLGKGIAYAHGRTDKVSRLAVAIGLCPSGITGFTTPDGKPVRAVLLFVIPKHHSDLYLKSMSALLRRLSDPQIMEQALAARTSEEVISILNPDLSNTDLETVMSLFARGNEKQREPAAEVLARTPPAYLAELVEDLTPEDRSIFFSRMEPSRAAAIVESMHLIPSAAALRRMAPDAAARILGFLDIARSADIIQQMKPSEQSAILKHLGVRSGKGVQSVLKYPPSTAGGVMTPEVMSVREEATVEDAVQAIATFPDKRQIDLYVISADGKLVGKCDIHDILSAKPATKVAELMQRGPETARPEQDQEELRHMVSRGNLRSLPVIGPHGTLLGVVTQDDILDVIEQEASEDILKMAGSDIIDPLHTPIMQRIRMRMPWLLLTLAGELFIALVISKIFQPTLEKAVVLAAFIPAIMATGGNAGLQSTTMVIRSLGMGTLKPRHSARLVLGEVKLGLLTGLGCGLIAALAAYLINWNYQEVVKISSSVFLAMVSATLATSFVGTLEPLILHRFKIDPATACGPFVTMFNDIFGSVVYLLIAMFMNFSAP